MGKRGYHVRVHPCSLQLVSKQEGSIPMENEENFGKTDSNKSQPEKTAM